MIAYVFWHRPQSGVVLTEYADGLRVFHERLAIPSASFRTGALPFAEAGDGYEDWYLVTKPPGQSYEEFLAAVPAPTVWQRQMVLGPAPEFCLVDAAGGSPAVGNRARTPIHPR